MTATADRTRPLGRNRDRPYTSDERRTTIANLRALADELERDDAARTQQLIGTLIDAAYASTASGTGNGGGGGSGLTVVEAKADRPDRTAVEAVVLARRLHRIRVETDAAWLALTTMRADRPVALCPEGHVLERAGAGSRVCTWRDPETGRRCGTQADVERYCENPTCVAEDGLGPVVLAKGKQRVSSVALDLEGQPRILECPRCRMYRHRNQRSWALAVRLTLPQVNELGVYSDEEPWAEEPMAAG